MPHPKTAALHQLHRLISLIPPRTHQCQMYIGSVEYDACLTLGILIYQGVHCCTKVIPPENSGWTLGYLVDSSKVGSIVAGSSGARYQLANGKMVCELHIIGNGQYPLILCLLAMRFQQRGSS